MEVSYSLSLERGLGADAQEIKLHHSREGRQAAKSSSLIICTRPCYHGHAVIRFCPLFTCAAILCGRTANCLIVPAAALMAGVLLHDWLYHRYYSGFTERSNFFAYPVRFFCESVAGGRVKQSPWTLQQLEALATS